jgi:hypothetical protein
MGKVKPAGSVTRAAKCGTLAGRRRTRDLPILDRIVSIIAAAALLVAGAEGAPQPGQAKECPVEELSLEARENALRTAPSCDKSMEIFQLCSYGASGDVSLGAIVTEKCEADFLTKLSPQQKKLYDREQERCTRKYRHESGTMYRSFEAFCSAQVAQSYARKFSKRKAPASRQ